MVILGDDGHIANGFLDVDLEALGNNSTNGLLARTGAGTVAARTLAGPAAGITVTNGDGVSGNPTLALANDLAAYEGLAAAGMVARTGDGTAAARTITGTAGSVTVTNGDGVAGAPTISLDATLAALAAANWALDALPIGTGADTLSQVAFAANTFPAKASTGNLVAKTITDFGLSLVDDADASAGRTTLGVTATGADTTYAFRANNLSDLANAATARTNLGCGTMATQNANAVAITGGTIDGTPIGSTTAAVARFTGVYVNQAGVDGSFVWNALAGPIRIGTNDVERARFTDTGLSVTGAVSATTSITSSGSASGIGYATGAGGTVTQITSKTTGVTINKVCGQITMHNAALASNTSVSFPVTCSAFAATDVPVVCLASGGLPEEYIITSQAVGAGTFRVCIRNVASGSRSEALVINFAVIKTVTS